MTTTPFHLPLGDTLLAEAEATFHVTDAIAALWVGGPSGRVPGRLSLTRWRLEFRPQVGQPHPQERSLSLADVLDVQVQPRRWLGLIPRPGGAVLVRVTSPRGDLEHRFDLAEPEPFAQTLREAVSALGPMPPPEQRLDAALAAGERERGRYTATLDALSFPQAFWHSEDVDELRDIIRDTMADLGVTAHLPADTWDALDLEVETLYGPEDYEEGEGSEHAGRLEQIARILEAANAALGPEAPKRFYRFHEDLPRWAFQEPCWLWLTPAQRDRLLALGVLSEWSQTSISSD
ncbi:MAG: hypothetical protein H6741_22575 [Alphaproteobacteria bacterium]|nr:hypothetical protein [Alphaproteobacteria bacterium]